MSEGAPPKVIYLMGAGRSGSTILGVALGNCAGLFYAGELDKWLTRSGVPALGGAERLSFWQGVRSRVDGEDLFGHAIRSLERSSALFSVAKWRTRRRLRRRYREVAEELYCAIAAQSGASYIVDSSHYPLRARELQSVAGIELYLVFLVRDAQGVVASFDRTDVVERRFDVPTANAYLWLTHLVSLYVFLRHPRRRRVVIRHEDLLGDPDGVLRHLLEFVGSATATPDFTSLQTGIPIQGNRLIRSEVVALRGDAGGPRRSSRLTSLLQLPWSVIFSRLAAQSKDGAGVKTRFAAPLDSTRNE